MMYRFSLNNKMQYYSLILILFSGFLSLNAQGVSLQNVFGGTGDDQIFDLIPRANGFYGLGYSTSANLDIPDNFGDKDFLLCSFSEEMDLQWVNNFGGPGEDWGRVLLETNDGNLIMGGTTRAAGDQVSAAFGELDIWLLGINADGNILFDLTLGGTADDLLTDLVQMPNGDFLITGVISENQEQEGILNRGETDIYLARINAQGELLWQKGFGSSENDSGRALWVLEDGTFYLCGGVAANDFEIENHVSATDTWIAHLDADGNIMSQATFGANKKDTPTDLIRLENGDIFICGETFSDEGMPRYHSSGDAFIMHINEAFELIKMNAYGGSSFDSPFEILQNPSGNLILGGLTQSFDGDIGFSYPSIDAWLMEIETGGLIKWSRAFGGSLFESIHAITENSSGQLVAAGYTDSQDGDVIRAPHGNHYGWIFTIDEMLALEEHQALDVSVYPNPSNDFFFVQIPENITDYLLVLKDAMGRTVAEQKNANSISMCGRSSGIYYLQIFSNNKQTTLPVVVK